MSPLTIALSGFLTGLGLIAAVGAQNAFLLRQGLRREHVLPLVLFCAVSDVVLIGGALLGMGVVLQRWPEFVTVATWGGATFLIGYGLLAARRALRPGAGLNAAAGGTRPSLTRALLTIAAVTWLNPHLYLDTMILGSIANSHGDSGRWWSYAGMLAASMVWFGGLGFGSAKLQPLFARPRSWQVLDAGIAVVMFTIALSLILRH